MRHVDKVEIAFYMGEKARCFRRIEEARTMAPHYISFWMNEAHDANQQLEELQQLLDLWTPEGNKFG